MKHLKNRAAYAVCIVSAAAFLAVLCNAYLPSADASRLLDLKTVGGPGEESGRVNRANESSLSASNTPEGDASKLKHLGSAYGRLPLSFQANRGQANEAVKFLARGSGYNFFLTPEEIVLVLSRRGAPEKTETSSSIDERKAARPKVVASSVLRLKFLGAQSEPEVSGLEEMGNKSNYYIGNDARKWETGAPNYRRVRHTNLYPGVDAYFYGNQRQLEYDFVVAPRADPNIIALGVEGAERVYVNGRGDLVLSTPHGDIRQPKPFIYQEVGGLKKEVAGGYVIRNRNVVGFRLGEYDKDKELVIDPELIWSSFLGGSEGDVPVAIGLDSVGNAYVTGSVFSPDFPAQGPDGAVFQSRRGDLFYEDAFVTKINEKGTELIFSTYVGGIYGDDGYDIAVDRHGNAYITGPTGSPDYPTTVGAYQRNHAGVTPEDEGLQNNDFFVSKFSDVGSLVYSTFLGGGAADFAYDLGVTGVGDAVVTGMTRSTNFPTTPGVFQPQFSPAGGDNDEQGFVTKIDPPPGPLIFIPGILGSQLCEKGTRGENCIRLSKFHSEWEKLSRKPGGRGLPDDQIEARDIMTFASGYGELMSAIEQMGYVRYQGYEEPSYRTPAGCRTNQRVGGKKPTLFPFPYDWRLSTAVG